ncbi:tetratricopeptide repeat protein 1-like isoform X2 [Lineus longissimus]|uniref:tetratricopeptide repeat protein 1-like isoform X2 n=1 Tax=Lineus longissimus TaxID=88925 RepID=UPI00315CFD1E
MVKVDKMNKMAEETSSGDQYSAASLEQPDETTEDLLKEFEERLQYSDSSDDDEFHDAQAELLQEEAMHKAELDKERPKNSVEDIDKNSAPGARATGVKTVVDNTDFSETIQSDDVIAQNCPGEASETFPNLGPSDRLPMFGDITTSNPSLPSESESADNSTIRDPCNVTGAAVASDNEPVIDVDELVQEAVEEGATMEDDPVEPIVIDEDQLLKDLEATWSEEEKEDKKAEAQELKTSGNELFKQGCIEEAKEQYTAALALCPTCFPKERSIMYSNRAACRMRDEEYEDAIKDCSKAMELNPGYLKCILRRAELHEKTEKLDEALVDYQKVLEIDPSIISARRACMRLPDQIKERNEKLKEEMMGKLKDLGNMILKPFGLSTDSFQMNQDPNTGGYSMNFKR